MIDFKTLPLQRIDDLRAACEVTTSNLTEKQFIDLLLRLYVQTKNGNTPEQLIASYAVLGMVSVMDKLSKDQVASN